MPYDAIMRITKIKAQEILRMVGGGERFFVADGKVCASLSELAEQVCVMSQEAFNHHCTSKMCDFAAWIADILHDETLAKNVRGAKGVRAKVEALIAERAAQLERYA